MPAPAPRDIEQTTWLLGRPPRSHAEYVRDTLTAWRAVAAAAMTTLRTDRVGRYASAVLAVVAAGNVVGILGEPATWRAVSADGFDPLILAIAAAQTHPGRNGTRCLPWLPGASASGWRAMRVRPNSGR